MTDPKDLLRMTSIATAGGVPALLNAPGDPPSRAPNPADLQGTLFGIAQHEGQPHLVVHLDGLVRVAFVHVPAPLADLWAALHRGCTAPLRLGLAVESCGGILGATASDPPPVVSMPFDWHVRYLGRPAVDAVAARASVTSPPVADPRFTVRRLSAELGYAHGPVLLAAREAGPGVFGVAPAYRPARWVGVRVPEAFVLPWVDVLARCIARDIFLDAPEGNRHSYATPEDAVAGALVMPAEWHAGLLAAFNAAVPPLPSGAPSDPTP